MPFQCNILILAEKKLNHKFFKYLNYHQNYLIL